MRRDGTLARWVATAPLLLIVAGCGPSEMSFEEQKMLRHLLHDEIELMFQADFARMDGRRQEADILAERYREAHARNVAWMDDHEPFAGPVPDDYGIILLKQQWDGLEALFPLKIAALEAPTEREFWALSDDSQLKNLQDAIALTDTGLNTHWAKHHAWTTKPGEPPEFSIAKDPFDEASEPGGLPAEARDELRGLFTQEHRAGLAASTARLERRGEAADLLRQYQAMHQRSAARVAEFNLATIRESDYDADLLRNTWEALTTIAPLRQDAIEAETYQQFLQRESQSVLVKAGLEVSGALDELEQRWGPAPMPSTPRTAAPAPRQLEITTDGVAYAQPELGSEPVMRVTVGETYLVGASRDGWLELGDAPVEAWIQEADAKLVKP